MAAAATPTTTYCNRTDIENRLSAYGVVGALDDDASGAEDTGGGASTPWINQALYHGTNRVNMFLQARYDVDELALSPIACEFAIVHACKWLCARRGNPVPSSLLADCQEADEMMREIKNGSAILPDAAARSSSMPSHLNVIIDRNFRLGKVRVVRPRSDPTPTDHAQLIDYQAEYMTPFR